MEKSFAHGLNFYELFWVFFIGCFVGVVIESAWCRIKLKRFESRKGLVYGPFNLVYGFGALVMTLSLLWLNEASNIWIIAFGALAGGVYEYACSVIQEKMFGSVSWDYKRVPNLNGRISLPYCVFWGLLSLLWLRKLYPWLLTLIEMIPSEFGLILMWICLIFIVFDSIISACVVYRMGKRLDGIPPSNPFWEFIDRHYPDERVREIYPNMKFRKST